MRINPKEQLFDQPVLKIREVIRLAMHERLWGESKSAITKQIADILHQPVVVARKVHEQLVSNGYVALKKEKMPNGYMYQLPETEEGRRFGIATANPSIRREKADSMLAEFIKRAEAINQNDELVYYVETIKVLVAIYR